MLRRKLSSTSWRTLWCGTERSLRSESNRRSRVKPNLPFCLEGPMRTTTIILCTRKSTRKASLTAILPPLPGRCPPHPRTPHPPPPPTASPPTALPRTSRRPLPTLRQCRNTDTRPHRHRTVELSPRLARGEGGTTDRLRLGTKQQRRLRRRSHRRNGIDWHPFFSTSAVPRRALSQGRTGFCKIATASWTLSKPSPSTPQIVAISRRSFSSFIF
mmetsp:Transcript_3881/g.10743  ORF Transcript_3881/g.10743 Transcript_3881/m.10743 type:complete len:215 (+) Transcript_3881:1242-1886(+)